MTEEGHSGEQPSSFLSPKLVCPPVIEHHGHALQSVCIGKVGENDKSEILVRMTTEGTSHDPSVTVVADVHDVSAFAFRSGAMINQAHVVDDLHGERVGKCHGTSDKYSFGGAGGVVLVRHKGVYVCT